MATRTMPFLINPRGKSMRKKKRNPPKGFSSWKAYMASIRPGAKKKKRARPNPSGGSTVARKRKRRRTSVARRSSSSSSSRTTRRRRYRRNPPAVLRNLPAFAMGAAVGAVSATGGKILARKGRALVRQAPGTVLGMAAEALIGIAAGALIATKFPTIGRDVALGGIQSPLESAISRMKLPVIGDALGADDYYLGFSDAVDSLNAGGGNGLGGYVGTGEALGDLGATDSGARYVAGSIGG
jgi:hypothetical protein